MFDSLLELTEFLSQLLNMLPFSVYSYLLLAGFFSLGTGLFKTLKDG